MRKSRTASFTLVELLVVMGVLAVLVITILVTLNPSEAQKKSRDVKRMKDMAAIEAIILQYINDGNAPVCTQVGSFNQGCTSLIADSHSQCYDSWITDNGSPVNLCNYAKSIPIDPLNGRDGTVVCGGTVQNPSMQTFSVGNALYFRYRLKMRGSDYKIGVQQESKSNAGNVLNDGGQGLGKDCWVETGSDMSIW